MRRNALPAVAACLVLVVASLGAQSGVRGRSKTPPTPRVLATATRLVVVTTSDWDAVPGVLHRYVRKPSGWQPAGTPVPVVVGKNGMAWDGRLVSGGNRDLQGPIKKEGDGRSPAGAFALGKFFGYAESLRGSTRYLPLTAQTECVDDPASTHYGQVLERSSVARVDWSSSEQMRRNDELYRWGVIVDYNLSTVRPSAGSCIFLHIWRGPTQGTAGCTAMAPEQITMLLEWLGDAGAALVQLPKAEYGRLMTAWKLPQPSVSAAAPLPPG
jgi:zinc D-Ala-D-Ala dipeptidase